LNYFKREFFCKIKLIFICFLLLNSIYPSELIASKRRKIISGVQVKVYKKERKHIETSALLCSLALSGYSIEEIKKNLEINFQNPISKSDHFIMVDIMSTMCPEFDNRKIFEKIKQHQKLK
tara:strand:+ start:139 stop:501 length:363 start_codon:yes stop_codon:yes gene_type:complete